MKIVLTIGGADCSSRSGIQADLKTFLVNGVWGISVITAIAAHGERGTRKILNLPSENIAVQLEKALEVTPPDAVKIGMLPDAETAHMVAEKLKAAGVKNIVANPRVVNSEGEKMIPRDAYDVIVNEVLPVADIITPDITELEHLTDMQIGHKEDLITAAKIASNKFDSIIATKAGRIVGDAADLYFREGYYKWFPGMIIPNANIHDAGNAMTACVAANLAKGYEPDKAYKAAKDCVTEMLLNMKEVGNSSATLAPSAVVKGEFMGVLSDEELSRM